MTRIEDVAFLDCQLLYKVTLPGSLTSIGTQAFVGCTNLEEMIVLAAVPPIAEEDAFDEVSRDIPVSVPAASLEAYKAAEVWKEFTNLAIRFTADNLVYQVTDVENKYVEVIGYDTNPTGVLLDIPKTVSHDGTTYSVTTIGVGAFLDSGLTGVTIPASVTSIGYGAFATPSITQINVESGNTSYCSEDGVLFNKEKTVLIQYPAGKQETSYAVPGTVTGIWTGAFYMCQHLNKVTLPGSLTSIGICAFSGPIALEEMIVLAAVPPTAEEDAFEDVSRDIPVYVPAESLEAYKAAEVWKEFTNLQAISGTAIDTPSMPESISIQGGMLHNPQQLPVIIYDLTGRPVYSGNATTVELPAGIYVVSCNGANGKAVF